MLTGYFPQGGFNASVTPNNQRPTFESIISKKLGPPRSVPPFVCLPKMHPSTGSAYLGAAARSVRRRRGSQRQNFAVPDIVPPPPGRRPARQRRLHCSASVDRYQKAAEARANKSQAQSVTSFNRGI